MSSAASTAEPRVLSARLAMPVLESAAAAAAVAAAARLGILEQLDRGPAEAGEVARSCGVTDRGAELLLAALAAVGLLEPLDNGTYAASVPLASVWALVEPWNHLDAAVVDGRPVAAADTSAGAESLYAGLAPLLAELFAPATQRAAELLAQTGPRVLDVGAGAAPWSLALAARDPGRTITAVDLPDVLAAARLAVGSAGLDEQFELVAGDMFTLEWPDRFDLVLAANVCHLFGEDANRRLVARLYEAVRPGGTVAIIDILADGSRSSALYALGLLLRSGTGRAYRLGAFTDWLEAAGFGAVVPARLGRTPPFTLLTARRPVEA